MTSPPVPGYFLKKGYDDDDDDDDDDKYSCSLAISISAGKENVFNRCLFSFRNDQDVITEFATSCPLLVL